MILRPDHIYRYSLLKMVECQEIVLSRSMVIHNETFKLQKEHTTGASRVETFGWRIESLAIIVNGRFALSRCSLLLRSLDSGRSLGLTTL